MSKHTRDIELLRQIDNDLMVQYNELLLGVSEQPDDRGTLGSLIGECSDGPAEFCIARLCGQEEAHEA